MATETEHSNVFQTDYEGDRARLDNLHPLTVDTDKLLHYLIRASKELLFRNMDGKGNTLTPLLESHMLTVLANIRHKNLSGYDNSFAEAQSTEEEAYYVRKLEKDVERWRARLETYLQTAFVQGRADSPAVQIARKLHEELDNTLRTEDEHNHRYYRMLHTIIAIQANTDDYLQQIENSGDMEPALALLVTYIKNYAGIIKTFNRRFASLPELYCKEVLHALPAKAIPDKAYLVISPSDTGRNGFTLERGASFAAGEKLVYKTEQEDYISPVQCVSVQSTYQDKSGSYLQTLEHENTDNAETLFSGGNKLQTGWQIESSILVLKEGKREVTIGLLLKEGYKLTDSEKQQGFVLQYSTEDSWTTVETECELLSYELRFGFTIGRNDAAPSPCTEEPHGIVTAYPAIRILTGNESYPVWAEGLEFESVKMEVSVSGIHDFTFMNELGETNATQPISPFGIQAEHGAWFQFGLGEAGMKSLKEMTLTGKWQNLPDTKNGLDQLYKDYQGVDATSFRIKTDGLKDGSWIACGDQPLFSFDHNGKLQDACITFRPNDNTGDFPTDKDGLFRVTLESPNIGFGTAAYRKRFTEVMVHNSRCKEKEMWALPQEPPLPRLADMELSYKAEAQAPSTPPVGELLITPVTITEGTEAPLREGLGRLLPQYPSPYTLYFAFADATGEQKIRMYLEMTFDKASLPSCNPRPDSNVGLAWSYWNGEAWADIPGKDITAEETAALTRSGFIEIALEEKIHEAWTDKHGRFWLRAAFMQGGKLDKPVKEKPSTLSVRGIWANCIRVTADGGDGTSLPAGTIQGTAEEDTRIGSVTQPLPGFGGRQAETETQCTARQSTRIHNRHRAVTARNYVEILKEHFPETDKVRCFTARQEDGTRKTSITVFSRTEDNTYFLSPTWKLTEMERTLKQYTSPFARLEVINPVYERTDVHIKVRLHEDAKDEGKVIRQLAVLAQDYLAPWQRKGEIPEPGQAYSMQALCSRLANHEDVEELLELTVNVENGTQASLARKDKEDERICGKYPWSILLPKIKIDLLPYQAGIEEAEIGGNFTIN